VGVTLKAGLGVKLGVVVNGKVPGVPVVNVTVPVTGAVVKVGSIGF
jgi:hypothetical protein